MCRKEAIQTNKQSINLPENSREENQATETITSFVFRFWAGSVPDACDVRKLAASKCLTDTLTRDTQAVRHFLVSLK
jgi:hypothetical protein